MHGEKMWSRASQARPLPCRQGRVVEGEQQMRPPRESDVRGDSAIGDAASGVLREQLGIVARHLRRASRGRSLGAKRVHGLRVATRRADAVLRFFGPWLEE